MTNVDLVAPVSCGNLSKDGFVLSSSVVAMAATEGAKQQERQFTPCVVGKIPNPEEFASGPDIVGNGLIIKPQGESMAYVPEQLQPFLPVIWMALNCDVLRLGAEGARNRWVMVRASRHNSDGSGKPHQSHVDGWHTHDPLGPSFFYLASDRFGTELRDSKRAPDGSIIVIDQSVGHRSPVIGTERRTFVVVASYANDPDPRSERGLHRNPVILDLAGLSRPAKSAKIDLWRKAGTDVLRAQYEPHRRERDLKSWLRGEMTPL